MQDLVGVGVADPREETRIGERALDGVVLARRAPRGRRAASRRGPPGRPCRTARAPTGRARRGARRASSSPPPSAAASRSRSRRPRARPGRRPSRLFFFQCRRPAIIRCSTRKRSPSSSKTMRFPIRERPEDAAARRLLERRIDRAQQERDSEAHRLERPSRRPGRRGPRDTPGCPAAPACAAA